VGVNVRHSAGDAAERLRMLTPSAAHALGHQGAALTDGQWSSDQAPGSFLVCPPGTSIGRRTVVVRPDSWVLPCVSTREQHWPTDSGRQTRLLGPSLCVRQGPALADGQWSSDQAPGSFLVCPPGTSIGRRTVVVRPGSWVLPCVSTRDQH